MSSGSLLSELNEIMWPSKMFSIKSMQHALGPVPAHNLTSSASFGTQPSYVQISRVRGADLQRRLPADSCSAELRATHDFCFRGDSVSVCLAC